MILRILFVFLIYLFPRTAANAQFTVGDARDLGLSQSTIAGPSYSGISKNISVIPEMNTTVCVTAQNKYYIKELSQYTITFQKANQNYSFQCGIGNTGNKFCRESFIESGVGKKLASKLSAGIKMQFHRSDYSDAAYKDEFYILPEAGLTATPFTGLNFGAVISNLINLKVSNPGFTNRTAELNAGISYSPSRKLRLSFSFIQSDERPLSFHAGMEYYIHSQLTIRTGWRTAPVSHSFGFMLQLAHFSIDFGIQTHPVLGNTTAATLCFSR